MLVFTVVINSQICYVCPQNLQKTINKCIESEIAARVTSQEGQQLKVVNVPKGSGDKKKK